VVTLSADFSATPGRQQAAEIQRLCDAMEAADQAGRYPQLTVERPWSVHNPVLEGEFASPRAIRWYLERELSRLAARGARISVCPGREALDLRDPSVTMVNIGVGPSNAKTITDHLAVLRPDLVLMIGHCAGLRNHQETGDLVLATAYVRGDHVLDDMLPLSVPVVSNHTLNTLLLGELTARRLRSRMGIVYPDGLPAADLRSADEPLLGTTDPEPAPAPAAEGWSG